MPQTPTRWRQMSPEERCGLAASYAMVSPWNVVGHRNLRYDSKGSQKKSLFDERAPRRRFVIDGGRFGGNNKRTNGAPSLCCLVWRPGHLAAFDDVTEKTLPIDVDRSTSVRPTNTRTHLHSRHKKRKWEDTEDEKESASFHPNRFIKEGNSSTKVSLETMGKKATLNNSATPRTERRWRRCSSGSIKSAPIIRAFEFDWVYFYMERTRFGCVTGDADWVARWRVSVWLRSPRIRFHGIAFLFLFCFSFFFSLSLSLFAANVSTERLRLFYVSIIAIGVRLFFLLLLLKFAWNERFFRFIYWKQPIIVDG